MKIHDIYYSPEFLKQWRKIPRNIQNKAKEKEQLFREDCFHPSLKTHKLKGTLSDQWSFYIAYHWRIVFYLEGNKAIFTTVGTHGVYR